MSIVVEVTLVFVVQVLLLDSLFGLRLGDCSDSSLDGAICLEASEIPPQVAAAPSLREIVELDVEVRVIDDVRHVSFS